MESQRGVAVGSTSIRRMTSGAPAMELLVGHRPIPLPPSASPVNYHRVLRAVHATVNPLAAALVVREYGVGADHPVRRRVGARRALVPRAIARPRRSEQVVRTRCRQPREQQDMLDVPARLADPAHIEVYGAVVVANRLFGIDPASTTAARCAGGCGDRTRVRAIPAATLTAQRVER